MKNQNHILPHHQLGADGMVMQEDYLNSIADQGAEFTMEKQAMRIVILDPDGDFFEELCESENGRFQFWDQRTVKRAEERIEELNNL